MKIIPRSYTLWLSNLLLVVCDDTVLYSDEIKKYTAFVELETRRQDQVTIKWR